MQQGTIKAYDYGIDYKERVIGSIALFVGVYAIDTIHPLVKYWYFSKESIYQEGNQSINHDIIKSLKHKCLDNGVTIKYVYYNPNFSTERNASVLVSPFGNLLFLGSGYGVCKNESDVSPLSSEQIDFIIGRECAHVRHNDKINRKLFLAGWTSSICIKPEIILSIFLFRLGFLSLSRKQDYDADCYASTDIKVLQSGADWFKSTCEKRQYDDILTQIFSRIACMPLDYHPSAHDRHAQLELYIERLKKEKRTI